MDLDSFNKSSSSTNEHDCGCDEHDTCANTIDDGSGCGCGCGCGCGEGPGTQYLTIILEDDSELKCQVLGIFGCGGNTYISLLNPTDDTVLLFRYIFNPDRIISVEDIVDDEEYDVVSKLFVAMHETQYEIVE